MRKNRWDVTSEFLVTTKTQWQTQEQFESFQQNQVDELNALYHSTQYWVIFN